MMRKPAPSLPDLDDEDAAFHQKMRPLVEQTLPKDRVTRNPDNRKVEEREKRKSGLVGAAQQLERIEAARGMKKRFEYVIPERVGKALAVDAANRGVSATTRLLEVLRDAGYPVIQE
ncbi:MAG: hypothetical protein INR71_07565, partial [Terriglobus roseus]|nr:hypothetical protein [Terriglobus roseus]